MTEVFELTFADDADLPGPDAADHVLFRWLGRRLGRHPSWLEVLALRAGLLERARRQVRWAWWRRLWLPEPPRGEDLVGDFLGSPEGQILFGFVGNMAALVAQLALSDPWEGFDGRHPRTPRLSRREALRDRMAYGYGVPVHEQVAAVLAYAEWKLSGLPVLTQGLIPEATEFLAPVHAAAVNAATGAAVIGICARLRHAEGSGARRRAVLRELDSAGTEALRLWPGIGQRGPGVPLGIWPPTDDDTPRAALPSSEPAPSRPHGL